MLRVIGGGGGSKKQELSNSCNFSSINMFVIQLIIILISQTEVINQQVQVIDTLVKRNDDITTEVQANKRANEWLNSTMSIELQKVSHVEQGYIDCGGRSGWSLGDGTYGSKYRTSKFSRPYASTPLVFTSLRQWMMKTDKSYVGIYTSVSSVNTTHVTVRCYTPGYDGEIHSMWVNWISLPHDV